MPILQIAKKIERAGLTPNQAKVYAACLFLGESTVQRIAEQAGINRVTAYDVLKELEQVGLATKSNGKKTMYTAEDPQVLINILSKRLEEMNRIHQEFQEALSELVEYQRSKYEDAPMIRFYKGRDGAAALSRYQRRKARRGMTIYGMINVDKLNKLFPDKVSSSSKERMSKTLHSKSIYSASKQELKTDKKLRRETVKLSEPIKADMSIYEETAAIFTYGRELSGVLIESKEIVAGLRQLFEIAWGKLSSESDNKDS